MANLSDPVTYRTVKEKLRAKGYKDSQIDEALGTYVAREQAPRAVEQGLVTPEEAFKSGGGLTTPGSVEAFSGIQGKDDTELGETERKFALGLDAAKEAKRLLEEGQSTGPIATRLQKAGEFFGGTSGTDFRANLSLANTALKSAFLGAQQSSAEIESLIDAISNPNQQEGPLKEKLNTLISLVEQRVPAAKGKPVSKTLEGTLTEETPELNVDSGIPSFKTTPNLEGVATTSPLEEKKTLTGLGEHAIQDVKDIAGGTLALGKKAFVGFSPGAVLSSEEEKKQARKDLLEMSKSLPAAIVDPYIQLVTNPVDYSYENPVDTVLALVPFLAAAKKLSSVGKAGEAAKATEIVSSAVSKTGKVSASEKTASGIAKTTELFNSPGSKDFIARNISREASQNIYKTLYDEGVFRAVTPKGIIENTQKALNSVGDDLAQVYKSSPATYTSDRLMQGVQQIADEFPALAGAQDDVAGTIAKMGKFDMETGAVTLSANDLWDLAKNIRQFGKQSIQLGDTGKMAGEYANQVERLLRRQLAYDVPGSNQLAVRYGNLKEYFDLLDEPSGLQNVGALDRIVGRVNAAYDFAKGLGQRGAQAVYDRLPRTPEDIIPPVQGASPIPELPEVPPQLGEIAPVSNRFESPNLVPGKSQVGQTLYRTGETKTGKPKFSVKKK